MHLVESLIVLSSPDLTNRQNVEIDIPISEQTVAGRSTSELWDIIMFPDCSHWTSLVKKSLVQKNKPLLSLQQKLMLRP